MEWERWIWQSGIFRLRYSEVAEMLDILENLGIRVHEARDKYNYWSRFMDAAAPVLSSNEADAIRHAVANWQM